MHRLYRMSPLKLLTTFWTGWELLLRIKNFSLRRSVRMAGGRTEKRQMIKGSDIIELFLEIPKWQAICCLGRTGSFPMPRRSSADPIAESLQNIFKGTFLSRVIDLTDATGDHNCSIGSYSLAPPVLRLHETSFWLRTRDTRGELCQYAFKNNTLALRKLKPYRNVVPKIDKVRDVFS